MPVPRMDDEFKDVPNDAHRTQLRYRKKGLCKCGKKPREGYKTCDACLRTANRSYRRRMGIPLEDVAETIWGNIPIGVGL